jgi:uncharacterized protein (TIGR03437 family)
MLQDERIPRRAPLWKSMRNHSLAFISLLVFGAAASAQQLPALNPVPSRVIGRPAAEQNQLFSFNPNLADGREFAAPRSVAVDVSVSPSILYVADTGNNRVLGWRDATGFRNGQAADIVIGQIDLVHTNAQGPGTAFSTGLSSPTGLAVDANGALYVADTANNRVLRYPRPFENQGNNFPDLFLGQPNLNSKGTGTSKSTLNLASSSFPSGLAFDAGGNLWVADSSNRRVLRFSKSELAKGGGGLEADLVVGQPDFTSLRPAVANSTRTTANAFATPVAIAFDPAGRLWVSDSDANGTLSRVLIFAPPSASDPTALRIMGVIPGTATSQDQLDRTDLAAPSSIFFIGAGDSARPALLDAGHSRFLVYEPFNSWPAATTQFSPLATSQYGQTDFHNVAPNQSPSVNYTVKPGPGTLSQPFGAAYANGELYVADTFNHRVIVLPQTGQTFNPATRVLGQDDFESGAINLIEGREFALLGTRVATRANAFDGGIAIDATADVPHLYVADTYNNRILGFKDFRLLKPGMFADIVIGQPNFRTGLCNQNGNPDRPTQFSLCEPMGLTVDSKGDLWVADHTNGRVLRFPAPFNQQGEQRADVVLGQPNFTTRITDPTDRTMSAPYGIAAAQANGLVVSDEAHNRVLFFASRNGQFSTSDSGKAASKVFGQPDFTSSGNGASADRLSAPRHVSVDTEARVYVADAGNNRVVIYDQVGSSGTPDRGANAVLTLTGISSPRAIYVSEVSGEVWVGDNNTAVVRRYPRFQFLVSNPTASASVQATSNPVAIAQDPFGALAVADVTSRVAVYYPGLQAMNAANYIAARALAPGVFASVCARGSNCLGSEPLFGSRTAQYTEVTPVYPITKNLADIQVLVNDTPAPLTYVSPTQINMVVPNAAPTSGTAEFLVVQASTGRIYAAGTVNMNPVSPGIFMQDFAGTQRRAAIVNQDGTINGPGNAAPRTSVVSIYATGQGVVPGAPPDGVPPTTLVRTPFTPRVLLGGQSVDEFQRSNQDPPADQWIQFSGLSQYPGLWQINVHIPTNIAPGVFPIHVFANSFVSNDVSSGYQTVIYIK